ncbi:hypothetical protein, partial [Serratia marcescens]|uniref:hypothetical protein n=1 Tax=Serratia marcescens TaxID=615 RepID=UPI001954AC44
AMSSNNNNELSIDYVRSVYGDSVDYFGEMKSWAQVVISNVIFIERWPSRRYVLRGEPESIACNGDLCDFTALVDWTTANGQR